MKQPYINAKINTPHFKRPKQSNIYSQLTYNSEFYIFLLQHNLKITSNKVK